MQNDRCSHPYQDLLPEVVLKAIEHLGYVTNARILSLNSYENRVYQVGLDDGQYVVAKFYRPGRWNKLAILEEHAFSWDLAEQEIPVIAPVCADDGATLHELAGFYYAVFPRQGGHSPTLDNLAHLTRLGRLLGRIHMVGRSGDFQHRHSLTAQLYGYDAAQYLLRHGFIPMELQSGYQRLTQELLTQVDACFVAAGEFKQLRIHGDCHPGNILWTDAGPHFVDLDDAVTGPAIQDIWMLLAGERHEMQTQLSAVLQGYNEFCDFNPRELHLVEALRTLRIMNYASWIAMRWGDPTFPLNFPWFNTLNYWQDHMQTLREQLNMLSQPRLTC